MKDFYLSFHPSNEFKLLPNFNFLQNSVKTFLKTKKNTTSGKKLFGELFSNLKKITMYRLKSNPMFHYIVWPRVLTFKAPFSIWIISVLIGYYAVWTYWPNFTTLDKSWKPSKYFLWVHLVFDKTLNLLWPFLWLLGKLLKL